MFNFVKTTWQFVTNLVSTMTRFVKAQWSIFTALFTRNKTADTAPSETPVMPYEEHATASSSATSTATTLSVLCHTTQPEAHIKAAAVVNEDAVAEAPAGSDTLTNTDDELSSNESLSTNSDNDEMSPAASNTDGQPTQRMDFKNLIALIGPEKSSPFTKFVISSSIVMLGALYYAFMSTSTAEAAQNATTPNP